jgi:hypothetical protein
VSRTCGLERARFDEGRANRLGVDVRLAVECLQMAKQSASVFLLSLLFSGCYRNVFGSDFETCDEVNAEMKSELAWLQTCKIDSDCGLILEGTSCGCTNELVAHKEFDATRFRGLQGRADELGCSAMTTDCSCPTADGFVCTNGVCGWNYVK